jgi:hypothetical protein
LALKRDGRGFIWFYQAEIGTPSMCLYLLHADRDTGMDLRGVEPSQAPGRRTALALSHVFRSLPFPESLGVPANAPRVVTLNTTQAIRTARKSL